MPHDDAFIWDTPAPSYRRPRDPTDRSAQAPGRITLREAGRRFGVKASTLRTWAKAGKIDGSRSGPGDQWMVTPESVAHHLSRRKPAVGRTAVRTERRGAARSGPTQGGGAKLVPRDAWDKLMDQLGNLHEAGLLLAEARERAAKAETEATFLRERLAEMRLERDALRADSPGRPGPGFWRRVIGRS